MRVHVVSDVHGADDALRHAGEGADALICLGDLVLYVDYDDHRHGIFTDLFGVEATDRLVALRTAKRFDEARAFSESLWQGTSQERRALLHAAIRRQYAATFAAMPTPAYLTYGNVDVPSLYPEFLREGMQLLDGATAQIGGRVFGFVGGGLRTPYRTPYEISDEEYAAKVAAIGAVDVLCAHIPPALPELLYDVRARRFERGSEATLQAIRDTQPGLVLSVTCTTRWPPGAGSDVRSASTSATSAARVSRTASTAEQRSGIVCPGGEESRTWRGRPSSR